MARKSSTADGDAAPVRSSTPRGGVRPAKSSAKIPSPSRQIFRDTFFLFFFFFWCVFSSSFRARDTLSRSREGEALPSLEKRCSRS